MKKISHSERNFCKYTLSPKKRIENGSALAPPNLSYLSFAKGVRCRSRSDWRRSEACHQAGPAVHHVWRVYTTLGASAKSRVLLAVARYSDFGAEFFDNRVHPERRQQNHIRQLETLGYKVTLEPAA